MISIARFIRQYYRSGPGRVEETEATYERDGETVPATVYRPSRRRGRLPGWVVLHGLTYQGRDHTSLIRFARAVAASGSVVFVPDIPEWRRLDVAPAVTARTIRAAILTLDERGDVARGRTGLLGFSFGATQALVASVDPSLEGHLAAIAAWGGYYDVHRLFRFGILGTHDLEGRSYELDPDPYGRWIMGANYLTGIPGLEDHGAVAEALHRLAEEAGRTGVGAWEDIYDPFKAELRAELAPEHHAVFDQFAPPAGTPPWDVEDARRLSRDLADAALRADPLLDPQPLLPRVPVPVLLAHGRDDRLVPFTEMFRLAAGLPADRLRSATVTSLFSHSGGAAPQLGILGAAREGIRFLRLLRGILQLI